MKVVSLFDIDNTLLDNDAITSDLQKHLAAEVGPRRAKVYWNIFEGLREKVGYADYLGALQEFRSRCPRDLRILTVSHFLIDYPFATRLYAGALDAIARARRWGQVALLSDGDVVFQPRKAERAGLAEAVGGNVLIYVHKEKQLADVAQRFPAAHYLMMDDKLHILAAIKKKWKSRVTTVFVRQGHYAFDEAIISRHPAADVTLSRIGDLAALDLKSLGVL